MIHAFQLSELNRLLKAQSPKTKAFQVLLEHFTIKHKCELYVIDLKYYSEERLRQIRADKAEALKRQRFELVVKIREEEKKCELHQAFREERDLKESQFLWEDGQLTYAYMGNLCGDDRALEAVLKAKQEMEK